MINEQDLVINGALDTWQRGFSSAVEGFRTADRFRNTIAGTTTQTLSRQPFAVEQVAVPHHPRYFLQASIVGVSGGSDLARIEHRLERVTTFAGEPFTLSFWARRSAGAGNLKVGYIQHFGTGGSPSTAVQSELKEIVISTVWRRYSYTFQPATLDGKTLGTNDNDSLILIFVGSHGTVFPQTITFGLAQIMAHVGSGALPYRPMPVRESFALCQPFFQKSFMMNIEPAQNVGLNTGEYIFPATSAGATTQRSPTIGGVRMLKAGPVTFYNPAAANAQVRNVTRSEDLSATTAVNVTGSGFAITATGSASTQVGDDLRVHWTRDAEILLGE